MKLSEEVRPGANRYVSGQEILQDLEAYLAPFKELAVITGEKSFQVFQDFYPKTLSYPIFHYDGTASVENGKKLAKEIGNVEAILAIGGGRLIDTCKVVAQELDCVLIIIPTLVSNCAPYTPVAALYHPDHTFDKVGYLNKVSYLTLVDYDFLLATPYDYFVAGIGDTLAKWYEMEGIIRQVPQEELSASVRLGFVSAKEIFKILFADSKAALEGLSKQKVSPAFGRIVDTIIELSGTVGGFAGTYGRMSGAHALHNGLSLCPETHAILHGSKVAYGVLVQLAYTRDYLEIEKLLPFYRENHLPASLEEINLSNPNLKKLKEAAEFAASPVESYRLIDEKVSGEKIISAIKVLESLVSKK